jgi:hypothetical protein
MPCKDAVLMNETSSSLSTRCKLFIQSHRALLIILIVAAFVWILVFSQAASDYILESNWNGTGHFNIFGFTVYVQFEGWSDYAYYYQTWGERFLNGYIPYTSTFDIVGPDHYVPYFFPPLYVYLCALGNSLPIDPFGTAVLICLFGYATALPVYGITTYISHNERVGEVAVATYLLNPLILFHTVYEWLNPAPFVFFMMMSFYLLMKHHRLAGTLSMVTAALFKQTVFFLALPLIAYLIKNPPSKALVDHSDDSPESDNSVIGNRLDARSLLKMAIIVVVYVVIFSFPYILDFGNYLFYIFLKPGMILLSDITILPASNSPVPFTVLFILIGAPEPLTQFINLATAYSAFLLIGILIPFVLMLLEVKDDENLPRYWRRLLFFTLLLLLSVHIFSPRGIYKYYCVALIPFFSIISCERMISYGTKKIQASLSMIINPLLITVLILIPNRFVYIGLLILVMIAYIFYKEFGLVYNIFSEPLLRIHQSAKSKLFPSNPEMGSS